MEITQRLGFEGVFLAAVGSLSPALTVLETREKMWGKTHGCWEHLLGMRYTPRGRVGRLVVDSRTTFSESCSQEASTTGLHHMAAWELLKMGEGQKRRNFENQIDLESGWTVN